MQPEIRNTEIVTNPSDCLDGPLLIIAGPGSGKTYTLINRIANLLTSGVSPETILVATFTEKAAKELRTRLAAKAQELGIHLNLHEMMVGTLHSLFLRFIENFREYSRLKGNYRTLDDFDAQFLVYSNFKNFREIEGYTNLMGSSATTSAWKQANDILQLVAKVREECIELEKLLADEDPRIVALGRLVMAYEELLMAENALDFSSIQTELLRILESAPVALQKIQKTYRYFMVDEYQDTNTIQERILLKLAAKHNNLCVVGDDDQGLYRFRGASIRNILEFQSNFEPGMCKLAKLTVNYRSHPGIIGFYNNWLTRCDWSGPEETQFRYDKSIVPPNDKTFPAYTSVIRLGSNESVEKYCEDVLAFIRSLQAEGKLTDYNQIAFLFRSVKHDQVLTLARYLESNGVPVFSPRSALFFEREEIQLVIGALAFLFPELQTQLKWEENADLSFWTYLFACKDLFANEIRKDKEYHAQLLAWAKNRSKAHLQLERRTTYAFAALFYELLEFPLFSRYLDLELTDGVQDTRPTYNLGIFSKLLHKFEYLFGVSVFTPEKLVDTLRDFFNKYLNFLWSGGMEEYEDFDTHAPKGCVSFMTIHQSKGLEFPIVVLGSLHSIPRKQHTDIDELLQARYHAKPPFEPLDRTKFFDFYRLFYTAFSRPQNLLVLAAHEKKGRGQGKCPSKYFANLYAALPHWTEPGTNLKHLQLEHIRTSRVLQEYAFTSHILLYESCPWQYKFYKEFGFAEVRTGGVLGGLLLHQTIEEIHKAVLRNEAHLLTDDTISGWFHTHYGLLSKQQRAFLHEAQLNSLLRQILTYRDRHSGSWHHILETEVDVSLVKPDYILSGTIDLIRGQEEGTVELVDFKSGNKPDVNSHDPVTRKTLAQYRRQLEVYAHLVEQRHGLRVARIHLYYPKEENSNPQISWPVSPTGVQATIQSFDEVVRKIEVKNYDHRHIVKTDRQCGDCDMRHYCNPKVYTLK